ncbi:hypothetical protein RvY_12669 [Ramazzottius varieornatus]|uniref:dipeptidyl-peptidase III n=1 Tax=Ramazzottius varieornatus TaxID=947166 RepID=A0A1D1VMJ8_RAMVA|nr:hypothetical protein RvY_12669 [Ramazzottius varieornatus]
MEFCVASEARAIFIGLFLVGFYANAAKTTSSPSGKRCSSLKSLVGEHESSNLLKEFAVARDTPIASLEAKDAFDGLQPDEKCFVYHMSEAAQLGGVIDYFQTSAESPFIYLLLQKVFGLSQVADLQSLASTTCQFSKEDWQAFLQYAAVFYSNLGNYFSYGLKKFIPNLPQSKFACLIQAVGKREVAAGKDNVTISQARSNILSLWNMSGDLIYNLSQRYRRNGLAPSAVTTYFSANCDEKDAALVQEYLISKKTEAWNSRVFKTDTGQNGSLCFEIRIASIETKNEGPLDSIELGKVESFKGSHFVFKRGDFSHFLKRSAKEMRAASRCFADPNKAEKAILDYTIQSFQTGSLDAHKNASRLWVRNKNPVIETYFGFIETYQDPNGMRASFEGFVAVVDKEKTARLTRLVSQAEDFLPLLPWPPSFEKDKFTKPDFTDLTVISFVNGGVPSGINLPNYNQIRQNEGFKNVNLGNVIAATLSARPLQYLTKVEEDLLNANKFLVFDIIVGLHELLGHGSGKQFNQFANGSLDFDAASLGSASVGSYGPVKDWYMPGQTYESTFGKLASSFEECRAETVATYLSLFPQVLAVWGINSTSAADVAYYLWLMEISEALQGLAQYDLKTTSWGEAHVPGQFAILRVMIEAGVAKVRIVNGSDGKADLLATLDKSLMFTKGKEAMANFLLGLQFYKSTGNQKAAQDFFDKYTSLAGAGHEEHLQWRQIAVDRKKPRSLLVQPNIFPSSQPSAVSARSVSVKEKLQTSYTLKVYPASAEGMIQSYQDCCNDLVYEEDIFTTALRDLPHFLI